MDIREVVQQLRAALARADAWQSDRFGPRPTDYASALVNLRECADMLGQVAEVAGFLADAVEAELDTAD